MKTKENLFLVELFTGVPMFASVLEIMKSKKFIAPDDSIPQGNTIVGVMSPLERACYTILQESDQKIKALGTCNIGHLDSGCMRAVVVELEICPFSKELMGIRNEYPYQKQIRDLMFALIESRLDVRKFCLDNVALHSNFQITTGTKIEPPQNIEVFQGSEELSLEAILEISLKGTFLEPVIEIMKSGKFVDEDDTLKKSEVFIREMTNFEKAIWTNISKNFDLSKEKSEALEKLMESDAFVSIGLMSIAIGSDGMKAGIAFGVTDDKHPDVIKAHQLQGEIKQLESSSKPLKSLFWNVVKSNIPQEKKDAYDTTGIRKGYKIVMFED